MENFGFKISVIKTLKSEDSVKARLAKEFSEVFNDSLGTFNRGKFQLILNLHFANPEQFILPLNPKLKNNYTD